MFVIIDYFPKCTWCIPLKNYYRETVTTTFSNILTKSKDIFFN